MLQWLSANIGTILIGGALLAVCLLYTSGLSIAESMLDRHHTLTRFLMALGVDAATAEADACKIEHDISQKTFDAICDHAKRSL